MLLHPYSLGHELWLIRESNSVLRGTLEGLPAAVLICCQTWEQLHSMRGDHLLSLKLWLWKRRTRKLDPSAELKKFLAYRDEGLLEFQISQMTRPDRGPSPRLPGAPFVLRLQQWLMTHLRKTEAKAWDYPAGLAKMRWAAHWEQEGGLDIYNANEEQEDAFISYWESRGGPSAMSRAQAEKEQAN